MALAFLHHRAFHPGGSSVCNAVFGGISTFLRQKHTGMPGASQRTLPCSQHYAAPVLARCAAHWRRPQHSSIVQLPAPCCLQRAPARRLASTSAPGRSRCITAAGAAHGQARLVAKPPPRGPLPSPAVILVQPTMGENIGAAARAMKVGRQQAALAFSDAARPQPHMT